jgi:hypothetical protein
MAEKYDVRMGIELHSPTQLKSAFIDSILEVIAKTKTQHFGFCPDLSAFTRTPQRSTKTRLVQQGARENIVDYIISAYQQRLGPEKTVAEVKRMGGNEVELNFAGIAGIYHSSNNDPKDLLPLVPYCYHVHGKFSPCWFRADTTATSTANLRATYLAPAPREQSGRSRP